MNQAMTESGAFDMENRLYVPWDFDVANQAQGIEDAIAQDVDAIMLTSLSRAGLAASVERATAAGVPVILCMAGAETDEFVAEVSSDMPRMGYDSAQAVAEQIGGEGRIVMIHGIAGVDAAEFWKLGAHAAFAEYPDIEIVAEQNANWSTADALEVMRTILVEEPEIDAIWTGGFEMGVGIVDAYREAGIDVPFIGGTGITNGFLRTAIEDEIDFFAVQFPPAGSSECVNTVIDVLEGNAGSEVHRRGDVAAGDGADHAGERRGALPAAVQRRLHRPRPVRRRGLRRGRVLNTGPLALELSGITKRFGPTTALDDVSLTVERRSRRGDRRRERRREVDAAQDPRRRRGADERRDAVAG